MSLLIDNSESANIRDHAPQLRSRSIIPELRRLQALETGTFRLLGGWLPGISVWELKHDMGYHIWQGAQHSRDIRTRLWELRIRNPDLDLDPSIAEIFVGLAHAQTEYELIGGIYLGLKTALLEIYQNILENTHKIYDAPTVAILGQIHAETQAHVFWAKKVLPSLAEEIADGPQRLSRWMQYVEELLALKLSRGSEGVAGAKSIPIPPPAYSPLLPFLEARRDKRFKLAPSAMAMPESEDHRDHRLFQFFHYTQEMQAAETLGSLLWETDGMEWEFYYDIARHCYDEQRHSAMGESRLKELGYHVTDFPNTISNYGWRQLVDPMRRYCILTYIVEAGSFTYKNQTYRNHIRNQDYESAEAVFYDIVDETMHVRFGQKWVPMLMKRFGYEASLDALVQECRELMNPLPADDVVLNARE